MKLQYVSKLGAKLHMPKTPGSAGYDIETPIDINLYPGETMLVDTGIVVKLPKVEGKTFHLKIYPRSSTKFVLVNSVGVIDADYCGPNDTIKLRIARLDLEPAANRIQIVDEETLFASNKANVQLNKDTYSIQSEGLTVTHVQCRPMGLLYGIYDKSQAVDPLLYKAGDRFAQLVIEAHETFELEAVEESEYKPIKDRGGFGSTGTR